MILFSWKINLTLFFFVILPKEIPKLRLIVLKIKIVYLYSKLISTTDTDYDYLQGTEPVFSIVLLSGFFWRTLTIYRRVGEKKNHPYYS